MSVVQDAITEIDGILTTLLPQREGLADFARLNLQPHTMEEVTVSIHLYDLRIGLLQTAKTALERLLLDGHPDMATREIDLSALNDLQANAATIEAALATFASNAAQGMNLSAGPVQDK
jgi:hypothetical protein